MGYYQGDPFRGSYRGDPGFFSFLGKIAKVGAGFIPGVGGLVGKATGAIEKVGAGRVGAIARAGAGAIIKHPVLSAAGAAGAVGAAGALAGRHVGVTAGVGMKGFHVSRKTGKVVRNRRMNPANGRALRRALRRAHAFERLARRVIGFSSPRRPKGHMYFKRKKHKK